MGDGRLVSRGMEEGEEEGGEGEEAEVEQEEAILSTLPR